MNIELLSRSQHEQMVDLLAELHAYYNPGQPISRDLVAVHLTKNLCGADSQLRLVTASRDGRLLGFAAIYLVYSVVQPEVSDRRQCVLKELFVSPSERSQGVGRKLMVWIANYAVQHSCGRMDWSVKASNDRGIEFYQRTGAHGVADRLSYRLDRRALEALATDFV